MHILEGIAPEKTFTATEIISDQVTHVMVRMYDFMSMACETDEQKEFCSSVRDELYRIRCAVESLEV